MVLMNIFDLFDLDNDGLLNRDEFNLFNVRTGDENVNDEQWNLVLGSNLLFASTLMERFPSFTETFDTRDNALTLKGFTQLHELEVEESEGDLHDVWTSLEACGYDNTLVMVKHKSEMTVEERNAGSNNTFSYRRNGQP